MMASINLENELPVTVNSAKVFLVALRSKLALTTQDSKIIGKWFAGIYSWKKSFVYVERVTKRFFCLAATAEQHLLNSIAFKSALTWL